MLNSNATSPGFAIPHNFRMRSFVTFRNFIETMRSNRAFIAPLRPIVFLDATCSGFGMKISKSMLLSDTSIAE